jgi:hypothetical protein
MKYSLTLSFFLYYFISFSQQSQTIKGRVLDIETFQPMFGATIYVNMDPIIATTSDMEGYYRLEQVPVGRVEVLSSFISYEAFSTGLISVNSGKELVVDIYLNEKITQTKEVIVQGKKDGLPKNESFQISTKSFSIAETSRFAGSLNDPGRVALNSPGVMATQDNNNDVIVRGNSSIGILWRLEGIDVPNVNHFSRPGSSGGGITALSPYLLSNADFSTGAFPSEYGNASAGVFDLKYRKGNNERHEFTVRAGIIGLNFGAEGPINKSKKSSYIFNYRYSTLGILNKLGLHVVGEQTDNTFQDLSFNFNFPTKKKAYFNVFGLGGLSAENTNAIEDPMEWEEYQDRIQVDFVTNLGVLGASWTQLINDDSYIKTVVAGSYNDIVDDMDTLGISLDYESISSASFRDARMGIASTYHLKIRPGLNLKTGLQAHQVFYSFAESKYDFVAKETQKLLEGKGNTTVFQPFVQLKYQASPNTTIVGGFHALYLELNRTYSIEPRLSIQQKIGKIHRMTIAYGKHGQHLPMGSYFTQSKNANADSYPNMNLKMIQSHHLVYAYEVIPVKSLKLKVEPYFQYLYNLPVSPDSSSTYMLLNERKGFANDSLVSEGTGMNYGVDFSIEKFYSKNWFLNVNASVFSSTYKTVSGEKLATANDNRFGLSFMAGKEFPFKKNNFLELGLRIQYTGGFRYTPIDKAASALTREEIGIESLAFTERYKSYFRPDLRISYKKNKKNYAWNLSLDLANFINYKNVLRQVYNRDLNELEYSYQLGLLPIISFQVDFFGKKSGKKKLEE